MRHAVKEGTNIIASEELRSAAMGPVKAMVRIAARRQNMVLVAPPCFLRLKGLCYT